MVDKVNRKQAKRTRRQTKHPCMNINEHSMTRRSTDAIMCRLQRESETLLAINYHDRDRGCFIFYSTHHTLFHRLTLTAFHKNSDENEIIKTDTVITTTIPGIKAYVLLQLK